MPASGLPLEGHPLLAWDLRGYVRQVLGGELRRILPGSRWLLPQVLAGFGWLDRLGERWVRRRSSGWLVEHRLHVELCRLLAQCGTVCRHFRDLRLLATRLLFVWRLA